MKTLLKLLLLFSILLLPLSVKAQSNQIIDIHYFQNNLCSSCQEVKIFFDENLKDREDVNIIYYNTFDDLDRALMDDVLTFYDLSYETPTVVIGSTILQGSEPVKSYIESVIEYYRNNSDYSDVVIKIQNQDSNLSKDDIIHLDDILNDDELVYNLPIFGPINLKSFSLLLGAVFIGIIDGFNPCAMWVLIFLITMLINLKDKKRVWILGLTFIFTSGIIYFIIMMAWFELISFVIWMRLFQVIIGIIALAFAALSIRNFWRQRQIDIGCEVTSKDSKIKLMNRIKAAIQKKSLLYAVIGVVAVALTVNIIELACSAGLPAIYTSMLAYQNIGESQSIIYILVYVFFFILDDLLIFAIAVITFKVTGISNKYVKYSNLIGGLIMLFIGLSLIFFPQLLF
ncbi:MAG: hypothetical protein AB7E09_00610 [Candidatus Izemoplasmatales bacterium]